MLKVSLVLSSCVRFAAQDPRRLQRRLLTVPLQRSSASRASQPRFSRRNSKRLPQSDSCAGPQSARYSSSQKKTLDLLYKRLTRVSHSLDVSSARCVPRTKRRNPRKPLRRNILDLIRNGEQTSSAEKLRQQLLNRSVRIHGPFRRPTPAEKERRRRIILRRLLKSNPYKHTTSTAASWEANIAGPDSQRSKATDTQVLNLGKTLKWRWESRGAWRRRLGLERRPHPLLKAWFTREWKQLLEAHHQLWMQMMQSSRHIQTTLLLFEQMARHQVRPEEHLKALCHFNTDDPLLLIATASSAFFHCLLLLKIHEPRVAQLVLSRVGHGDMCHATASLLMLQLQYCSECFNLQRSQLERFTKPLHRHLALGHLTPDEKRSLASLYARYEYAHHTFGLTMVEELADQLEVDLYSCRAITTSQYTTKRKERLCRSFFTMEEERTPGGVITRRTSTRLSSQETRVVEASHRATHTTRQQFLSLLNSSVNKVKLQQALLLWRQHRYTLSSMILIYHVACDLKAEKVLTYRVAVPEEITGSRTGSSTMSLRNCLLYLLSRLLLSVEDISFTSDEILGFARLLPRLEEIRTAARDSGKPRFWSISEEDATALMRRVFFLFQRGAKRETGLTEYHAKLFEQFVRWFQEPQPVEIRAAQGVTQPSRPFIHWTVVPPHWFLHLPTSPLSRSSAVVKSKYSAAKDLQVQTDVKRVTPLAYLSRFVTTRCSFADPHNFARIMRSLFQLTCDDYRLVNAFHLYTFRNCNAFSEEDIRRLLPVVQTVKTSHRILTALALRYQTATKFQLVQPWNNAVTRIAPQRKTPGQLYRRVG